MLDRTRELTQEGMALIAERATEKERQLAEMRQERAAQYAQRHSHVGVEIGRGLRHLEHMVIIYGGLGYLSNTASVMGHEESAGTLASLASGIERAAFDMYGPEGLTALRTEADTSGLPTVTIEVSAETVAELELSADGLEDVRIPFVAFGAGDPIPDALRSLIERAGWNPDDPSQPRRSETLKPLGIVEDRTPEQLAADGDGPVTDAQSAAPVVDAAQAAALGISTEQLAEIQAAAGAPLDSAAQRMADADDEAAGHDEEALSPEPLSTPQRAAAQARRAARKAAKGITPPAS